MRAITAGAGLAAALALAGALAPRAGAATLPADCAGFASVLAAAAPGDTIVLTGMCSAASYALPATAQLTIEGAPGSANGFDGTGASGPALHGAVDGLTIANLTFRNYDSASSNAVNVYSGGSASHPFVFSGDTFTGAQASGSGGGLAVSVGDQWHTCTITGPVLTLTGSTFTSTHAGGGAVISVVCPAPPEVSVSGNSFSSTASLDVGLRVSGANSVTQSGNVIDDEEIDYGSLSSTRDLVRGKLALGGAIGPSCTDTPQTAVIVDDFVGSLESATCSAAAHYGVTALDSTIGVARGGAADLLTLANTILHPQTFVVLGGQISNDGVYGFGATSGANVSASHSDLCVPGSSTVPFPGSGNICADPALYDGIHEQSLSPTIDAGSNALVPAGLATDLFGNPRILDARASGVATVDMGAEEYPTAAAGAPSPPPPVLAANPRAVRAGATVAVSCVHADGPSCTGVAKLSLTEVLSGHRVVAVAARVPRRRRVGVTVGQAAYSIAQGHSTLLAIRLDRTGRALLRRFHRLPVRISVLSSSGGSALDSRLVISRG